MAKPIVDVITNKVPAPKTLRNLTTSEVALYGSTPFMKISSGGVINLRTGQYFSATSARYWEFKPAASAEFKITE